MVSLGPWKGEAVAVDCESGAGGLIVIGLSG